jgi:phosphate transport system permease protein
MSTLFPTSAQLDEEFGAPHPSARRLPHRADYIMGGIAAGLAVLLWLVGGWAPLGVFVVGWMAHAVGLYAWSRVVEGRRKAVDRLVTTLIWSVFALALVPLVWVGSEVLGKGIGVISPDFFTHDMSGVLGAGGGILHALVGTLMITSLAILISVPIGVLAAIYLVEYGARSRLAGGVTFLVDVMTGIPSIVAGLFAFALFTLIFGPAYRSGIGGAVALSLLMIPTVVRATEEMLKLVPTDLREASYALGVSKWRTIVKVVIPTALGGIAAGITLAIARVSGETAPLLIICGSAQFVNTDPFSGRMMTLPVFIYSSVTTGGKYAAEQTDRAWGAALVLVVIVMLLNLAARIVGKIFSPKTGR